MSENIIAGKKIALSVKLDVVSIQIICKDEYFANVLYDDILDRLQAGDGVMIAVDTEE